MSLEDKRDGVGFAKKPDKHSTLDKTEHVTKRIEYLKHILNRSINIIWDTLFIRHLFPMFSVARDVMNISSLLH